jgi:hypothetical protein
VRSWEQRGERTLSCLTKNSLWPAAGEQHHALIITIDSRVIDVPITGTRWTLRRPLSAPLVASFEQRDAKLTVTNDEIASRLITSNY